MGKNKSHLLASHEGPEPCLKTRIET